MRRVLVIGAVAVVLVGGGAAAAGAWFWNEVTVDTAGKVEFENPLAIPPLAPSEVDEQGQRVFNLTAQAGEHDFERADLTPTWGFNGAYLGPTLRAERGEQVVVNVDNQLPESTTVHWHGMHLPAEMDGGPHQPIKPGESWSPTWQIDQPAATLWYHPHPHGATEQHVYRGLAGMFILDDQETTGLDLPSEYGVDDVPVIVQDKKFTGAGQLNDRPNLFSDVGVLGDTVAVNGTVGPYHEVTTEQVRLRLLNGSTARTYDFGFADDRSFAMVGSDGGLLPEPHQTDRIRLSPGERAEIVVGMEPGEDAVLRSTPPSLGVGFLDRFVGGGDTLDILALRAADTLAPSPELPEQLVEVTELDRRDTVQERRFELSGRKINDEKMDMDRIDTVVERGSTEVWEVVNRDGVTHNFHVHDVQFQVLTVDGQAPPPELAGWKDTVYLPPNQPIEIIARFTDYADPDVPYMYHCHLLTHEDGGMMGQFVVVEPGQQPGGPAAGHEHEHEAG